MFETLRQSFKTGVVTTSYPKTPPEVSSHARGKPEIDWAKWKDARPAAAVCPTGAIAIHDNAGQREAQLDLGKCIFCGLCADVDKAIRMTNVCECAAAQRQELITTAKYALNPDGTHARLSSPVEICKLKSENPESVPSVSSCSTSGPSLEIVGQQIQERANKLFGRSLHIRQVDAGSCNGCEIEIVNLN